MTRKKHMSFIMNVDRGVYPSTHITTESRNGIFPIQAIS